MKSRLIDGPKPGEWIYNNWSKVTAEEYNGSIYLSSDGQEYLKITIIGETKESMTVNELIQELKDVRKASSEDGDTEVIVKLPNTGDRITNRET